MFLELRRLLGFYLIALLLIACQPIQAPSASDEPAVDTTIAEASSEERKEAKDNNAQSLDAERHVENQAENHGEIIAEGFHGPQGILVADDGTLWVIESGVGGETEIDFFVAGAGPTKGTVGSTARIVQIAPSGEQEVIATLPSIVAGQDVIGGGRLAMLDGVLYATSGQWLAAAGPGRQPFMGSVVRIAEGEVIEVASTWELESAANPDGFVIDSHPYGMTVGPDGLLWVADAAANDLLTIDPIDGAMAVVTTFAGMPGPFPNRDRDDAMEVDPVPTGIAFDETGTAYVSLLSGFPFIPGSTKVVQIDAAGNVSDYATGLTMLTDLRLAPDGNLYAVQFAIFGDRGPTPNSGAIVRVHAGDASVVVADGLSFPTSIDFDGAGNGYVTINGVGAPGSGAILRIDNLIGSES